MSDRSFPTAAHFNHQNDPFKLSYFGHDRDIWSYRAGYIRPSTARLLGLVDFDLLGIGPNR